MSIIGKDLPYDIKPMGQMSMEAPKLKHTRTTVISGVIFNMIKSKDYTVFDFYSTLQKYKHETDLCEIRSDDDGYNMLHELLLS